VWGGIIGDDGLEGIKIAQGDAIGEAYLAVQRIALDLRQRGIVLAVSSKNSDEVARAPFEQHPEMLLKLEHIAVFQANWNDKATNIQAIAEELSLGLDSIVFLDDNPAERGLVRKLLPQVAVPELPDDPSDYARTLAAGGYFEAITMAAEDLKRADFYQDNAKRAGLQKQAGGVDAYLASLDMTITLHPFDGKGRARIVQLINKSNQYNLTTRRYTEPEILDLERDPSVFTLQVRLTDIFGDNGMISVVICRPLGNEVWDIDTWLMSCRVLGRKVEHMVLREILDHARAAGIHKLIGTYRPTDRNRLVVDHYGKLGFNKVREEASGLTEWELLVDRITDFEALPMNVVSTGFVIAAESPLS
jgi:FkbH-like protein